jgi:hypothetical protein
LVLAWIACVAGIGAGIAGCVLLVSNPRRDDERVFAATVGRRAYEPEVWAGLVGVAANDALGTLRRLASRAQPVDATVLGNELRDVGARFRALRRDMPARIPRDGDVARHLDVAATGADVEAARLAGGTVVRNDRRAFLDAVRALREVPVHTGAAVAVRSAPTASGDVAPSFTVA